jgi:hypothetical protein
VHSLSLEHASAQIAQPAKFGTPARRPRQTASAASLSARRRELHPIQRALARHQPIDGRHRDPAKMLTLPAHRSAMTWQTI